VARQGKEEVGVLGTERRAPSVFTDLFGNPLPEPESPRSEAKTAAPEPLNLDFA
jgi:hypothetical protein